MITNLKLPFDMEKNLLAFSQEHRKNAPVMGETLKVYIPLLMIDIEKGNGIITSMANSGSYQTFLNDNRCRPTTQNIIKTQNYITAKLENNTTWIIDNDEDKNKTKWMNIVRNVKKVISETNIKYLNPSTLEIVIGDTTTELRTDCSGFILTCLHLYTGNNYNFVCRALNESSGIMKTSYNFTYKPFTSWYACQTGDIVGNQYRVEIFSRIATNGDVYVYRVANDESIAIRGEEISCNINTFDVTEYSYIWTPPYNKNCISIGDKLECHASNGKLNKLLFNNNKYI